MSETYPLYLTEAQIAERLGISYPAWRRTSKRLERLGFPPRNPIVCNRRYWPAVRAFLDKHEGLDPNHVDDEDGEENWSN